MCGISGFLHLRHSYPAEELRNIAMRMADTLRHRGPNDFGVWADAEAGIALSMRRLAILDLSAAGHQPMESANGRYIIVFNGEIYNYEDLRNQLSKGEPAYTFRGNSDTEVMLAAFERWGVEPSVERFNGMFAFAVWDRADRSLTLGRDRFGEKPLYYSRNGSHFIFGSELKALRAYPHFRGEVDVSAIALFLRHSCVPAPHSIYTNTNKLPPAALLKISARNFTTKPKPYWSLNEMINHTSAAPFEGGESEAVEQLDWLLRDSVRMRMRSDVPLGAFLSGGIDSSTVVSLMQAQSRNSVRTFSIGNHDKELDEAKEASTVARHLGTEHHELYVTSEEAMAVIPSLPQIYDEPFADASQIPTVLVSRLAGQYVAVSLSGDAGDELFGGYTRHDLGDMLSRRLDDVPLFLRKLWAAGLRTLPPERWDVLFRACRPAIPARWRQRMPGYKLHKLASVLEIQDSHTLYQRLSSHWLDITKILPGVSEPPAPFDHQSFRRPAEEMMYLDTLTYLPDDILVKLDRATMAFSLEGRVPFLDHRIAEFAWRLPLNMRIRQRQGKWILRQIVYRYVPRELVDRPKSGFGIPLATWLRGPLRDWAESLLDENRLRQDGYLGYAPVHKIWREHLSGRANWEYHLWDVLMFQAWLDESRKTTHQSASFENVANVAMGNA